MVGGRKGIKAAAQDNFIGPNNVTAVTATDVGTSRAFGNGAITVSWTNPTAGNTPTGYYVYDGATLKATIAHPTNTTTITGLTGGTSYTYTVKAYDSYATASGASATATATTVPDTPAAPTITTVANTSTDVVTWVAPATGGKALSTYYWTSSDGKSGSVAAPTTSVNVAQEAGTAQTYNVYVSNANGNSATSANSASFTSFSFSPFGFTPFGFTPFGFTPFGFTPFGFTPFGFTPFGFYPYAWLDGGNSLAPEIGIPVLSNDTNEFGFIDISNIKEGDVLQSFDLETNQTINTIVSSINQVEADKAMIIDGDVYSLNHKMLVRKDGVVSFANVENIDTTYEKYSVYSNDFVSIYAVELVEVPVVAISINCQPNNNYFTNNVILSD